MVTTGMFEQHAFSHVITRREGLTFYAAFGDVLGGLNAFLGFGLFGWVLIGEFLRRKRNDRSS